MTLDELEIGKDAVIASVDCDDPSLRQHIFDMGLTPGIEVTMMKFAPMGDPMEIRLRGYELTLRRDDAARIAVVDVHDAHMCPRREHPAGVTAHPALGEEPARPRREGAALGEGAKLGFYLGAKAEQPVRVSWNKI